MLQYDKLLHFAVGFFITALALVFIAPPAALAMGVAAGAVKEIWDWASRRGTPDLGDFIATSIGAMVGTIPYWVFLILVGL